MVDEALPSHRALERVPIGWNHPIDKNSLRFKKLEHFRTYQIGQARFGHHQEANTGYSQYWLPRTLLLKML